LVLQILEIHFKGVAILQGTKKSERRIFVASWLVMPESDEGGHIDTVVKSLDA
jgi:hypothetical protein